MDENIFAGVIFCSRCGKALARTYNRRGKAIYYYSCNRCLPELKQAMGLETATRLPYAKLEPTVFDVLQKQIDVCIEIDSLIGDVINYVNISNKRNKLRSELNKHQHDCKKADDILAKAYAHHLGGLLDKKEFELARNKFERDKLAAESNIIRVQTELASCDAKKQRDNTFLANIRKLKGFTVLDKALISALIYRIEVTPLTNEINIIFNYKDELAELNSLIAESGVLTDVCS